MKPDKLKLARNHMGYSVNEMADALRLSPANGGTTIRKMEAGKINITGPISVAVDAMIKVTIRLITRMMNMRTLNSYQVGGDHYASKDIQPWDVMQAWMTKEAFAGYLHGNCIKYLARYLEKNGVKTSKSASIT
jgi:DNA-binding XRE family transcriptional regulator